ncbi:MAG TPA: hypothetical protein VMW18_15980 [Candidatus Binatia bacterium]|nr:hypothetical protein [Candidatus Binatia bacterium]
MVDELAEGFLQAVGHLIKAVLRFILQAIVEVLLETMLERLILLLGILLRFVYRGLYAVLHGADLVYRSLLKQTIRLTPRRGLAHAFIIALLIGCGFSAGAGATSAYHLVHHTQSTAQPR